jgi:hypothetical protein
LRACPTTLLFLSLLLPHLLYWHTHTFLISLFYMLLQHTPLVLLSTLPILSHTHTLYLLLPDSIPFKKIHVATHTPIFFLSQTQKG